MTPPFCSFSFRLHGFCIPCGQPCAETFELLEFNGNLAKTQKVLCEVFRSILSNSEATSAAKLIAIYVLVTKGFVPLSIRPSRRNSAEILDSPLGHFAEHLACGNGVNGGVPAVPGCLFAPFI
jgi:hypothetical protein